MPAPILVIGAGPTGLILALSLARRGVPVSIFDVKKGPGEASRAMVVQARTLELYDQFGFGREVLAAGIPIEEARFRKDQENVAQISFRGLGESLTPYPFPLSYPQDDHERFLVQKLRAAGVEVEWSTALTGFTQNASGVEAQFASGPVRGSYLVGCDGARSVVRQGLGLGFPGGTYQQLFFVADVRLEKDDSPDLVFNLSAGMLTLKLPVRSTGMHRLIGTMPAGFDPAGHYEFSQIQAEVEALLGLRVEEVNWFSTYHVHHRVADHFQQGRAFLAGDAGHIHSPAGGQGMNTGLGDAINLGWKLAAVSQGRASEKLLETYEQERLRFARSLVKTTDQVFTFAVSRGWRGTLLRSFFLPFVMPKLFRVPPFGRFFFRLVSQTGIEYGASALSRGDLAGERLPWVKELNNFAPLASLDWQLHIYGDGASAVRKEAESLGLAVHEFPAHPRLTGAFLIRPDGYVALGGAALRDLRSYAETWGLKFKGGNKSAIRAG